MSENVEQLHESIVTAAQARGLSLAPHSVAFALSVLFPLTRVHVDAKAAAARSITRFLEPSSDDDDYDDDYW